MASQVFYYAMNRGLISRLALARLDLDGYKLFAEVYKNYVARAMGSAMLRPGLKYIGATDGNNPVRSLPFIFSTTDHAIVELSNGKLRVWDDDVLLQRIAVSSAVANGTFGTDLTSWTDADESGAASDWLTGGYMSLTGTGSTRAIRRQQVSVAGGDINDEHALNIVIARGPVTLKVGSSAGADDFIREIVLETGYHSLSFAPTGDFHIEFSSYTLYPVLVDSVAVASSGDMELTTPWGTDDLALIRADQSGDVMYVACQGYQQRKIIRWDNHSWSVVKYEPTNGPCMVVNTTPITLTASGTTGDITLTASASLFLSGHVESIFKIVSLSQKRTATVSAQNSFTESILVSGTGGDRVFSILITGSFSGTTVTLQQSIGDDQHWTDFDSYTTEQNIVVDDGLHNQLIYYRLGVKTGEYSAGPVSLTMAYGSGVQTGYVKIRSVASAISATASVLSELGSTDATDNWHESVWSGVRGWPTCVSLDDGRLWWHGKYIVGSVSDDYENFDGDIEGDSAPVIRQIGFGPVDQVNWAKSSWEQLFGTAGGEFVARSNGENEPKTVTNFNIRPASGQGGAKVDAMLVDKSVVYVGKSGTKVFDLSRANTESGYDSIELGGTVPEVTESGIIRIVAQRNPDTRIHFIRNDGKVALLMIDNIESIRCWAVIETDGIIEDAVVLPGTGEDQVYYVVKRTINSQTVRFYEKWAKEDECRGGTYEYNGTSTSTLTGLGPDDHGFPNGITVSVYDENDDFVENRTVSYGTVTLSSPATYARLVPAIHRLADSFIVYSGAAVTTITGLGHLEGETVVVRGNGKDLGTYTVSSSQITGLPESVTLAVIGLAYTGRWKSTKVSEATVGGSFIGQKSTISQLGLVLADTKQKGLRFGPDFDNLQNMREVVGGKVMDDDYIWRHYDVDMTPFLKKTQNDTRICLEATAPNPATIMGFNINVNSHAKS